MFDSVSLCEALARHTEISGYDVFQKDFMAFDGTCKVTVWCVLGEGAASFRAMAEKWLEDNGYKPHPEVIPKEDPEEP